MAGWKKALIIASLAATNASAEWIVMKEEDCVEPVRAFAQSHNLDVIEYVPVCSVAPCRGQSIEVNVTRSARRRLVEHLAASPSTKGSSESFQ